MIDPMIARTKAIRVIYQMLEITKGQLDPNEVLALGYYLGVVSRETEPTTLHAAIALSSGNKAKAEREDAVVIVQETTRLEFRWWTFDPHSKMPLVLETKTDDYDFHSEKFWTTERMYEHFKAQDFDIHAPIWTPV